MSQSSIILTDSKAGSDKTGASLIQVDSDHDFSPEGSRNSEKVSLYSDLHSSVIEKRKRKLSEDVMETDDLSVTEESEFVMSNSNSASEGFSVNDVAVFSTRHLENKITFINSDDSEVGENVLVSRHKRSLPKRRCRDRIEETDSENIHTSRTGKKLLTDEVQKKKRSLFSTPLAKKGHQMKSDRKEKHQANKVKETEPKPASKEKMKSSKDLAEVEKSGHLENKHERMGERQGMRAILPVSALEHDTKVANRLEEERLVRLSKRSKDGMTDFYTEESGNIVVYTRFCLEKDADGNDRVNMDENVVKKLKVHQVEGVQFLWDNTIETVEHAKNNPGSGAILAQCMGLGKTLQVVSFVHTVLKAECLPFRTVLVIVPTNTILNWVNEFEVWIPESERLNVVEISQEKDEKQRSKTMSKWYQTGGVLIIGYQMFRSCVGNKRMIERKLKTRFKCTLLNPGPDIVVCDEGHLLKNDATALSKAVAKVRTLRRIVLTGTPLQNNLLEYHCMVNFVKPNLLGTKTEFKNQFVVPIENGQRKDASEIDVRVMKHRSHVLHELLSGCVQRRDYSFIRKFLPPKYEYVLSVRLTEKQVMLYRRYLEVFCRTDDSKKKKDKNAPRRSLFRDYQALAKIWTHPALLLFDDPLYNEEEGEENDLAEEERPDEKKKKRRDKTNEEVKELKIPKLEGKDDVNPKDNPVKLVKTNADVDNWFSNILIVEDQCDLFLSGKYVLLLDVLKGARVMQEKVLLFSQSLATLTLIEDVLEIVSTKASHKSHKRDKGWKKDGTFNIVGTETGNGSWEYGKDYLRLDGSSSASYRKEMCDKFNSADNKRCRLFLISTRAGSLGVNLVAANRVILFDASWNPSHDIQSMFRCYRFGQVKPVYVYRFIAQGTMEEKVYNRQVTKESLSLRVIDENQIDRHFNRDELEDLYKFEPVVYKKGKTKSNPVCSIPKDQVLAEIMLNRKEYLYRYHEHDSLLEHKEDENLNDDDKIAAWKEYEKERKGIRFLARRQTRHSKLVPKISGEKVVDDFQDEDNATSILDYGDFTFDQVQQEMADWALTMPSEKSNPSFVKMAIYQFVKSVSRMNPEVDEKIMVKYLFEDFPTFYLKSIGINDSENDEHLLPNANAGAKSYSKSRDGSDSEIKQIRRSRRNRKHNQVRRPRSISTRRKVVILESTSESNRRERVSNSTIDSLSDEYFRDSKQFKDKQRKERVFPRVQKSFVASSSSVEVVRDQKKNGRERVVKSDSGSSVMSINMF